MYGLGLLIDLFSRFHQYKNSSVDLKSLTLALVCLSKLPLWIEGSQCRRLGRDLSKARAAHEPFVFAVHAHKQTHPNYHRMIS